MLNTKNSYKSGLVSVIIPTFNRSDLVVKAIDSVLCQSYRNFEIIVVDDCSTDDTIKILQNYGDNIQLIRNSINSYVGFSRNNGASFANGEYIAFLDSDDKWLPNKLELQISWMKKNQFEISTTNFFSFQKNTNQLIFKNRPYSSKLNLKDILYGVFIAPGSTLIIKRDYFIFLNGYDITYKRLEDWDLLIKIFLTYKNIGFLSLPTAEIFSSNEYTYTKLQDSGKKLFITNYRNLFLERWYYPILLTVGILFELFVANFRSKNYFQAYFYFLILNLLSLFNNPYLKIYRQSHKKS